MKINYNLHPHRKVFFLVVVLLLAVPACPGVNLLQAQSAPTVKVKPAVKRKKKKDPPPPPQFERGRKKKDNYKRPPSQSPSGKVRKTYQQPPSMTVNFDIDPDDYPTLPAPDPEEGGEPKRPGLLKRLLHRNQPSLYSGKMRYRKTKQPEGTKDKGEMRQLRPSVAEARARRKQRKMAKDVSGSRAPTKNYQERLNRRQSDQLQEAGMYRVRKKKDKAAAYTSYKGSIRVPTLKARTRHFERLSRKVHQYDGDIRYRKPDKDMHPSAFHLKGKRKDFDDKKKYRKKRLFILRIFRKRDIPQHLKEKERKPRYDKEEGEIWYY